MIEQLAADLKKDEGWREHAYQDHLGYWTIGYGFLIDQRRGGKLPKAVAEYWLEYLIEERIKALCERLPWFVDMPDDVQRALLNMSYQLGINGLLNFRKMLAALERCDRHEAARQALDSTWARQTPARAKRMAALIRGSQ